MICGAWFGALYGLAGVAPVSHYADLEYRDRAEAAGHGLISVPLRAGQRFIPGLFRAWSTPLSRGYIRPRRWAVTPRLFAEGPIEMKQVAHSWRTLVGGVAAGVVGVVMFAGGTASAEPLVRVVPSPLSSPTLSSSVSSPRSFSASGPMVDDNSRGKPSLNAQLLRSLSKNEGRLTLALLRALKFEDLDKYEACLCVCVCVCVCVRVCAVCA